jgi:hypothetical protein
VDGEVLQDKVNRVMYMNEKTLLRLQQAIRDRQHSDPSMKYRAEFNRGFGGL